jgi:hypothetical protein
MHPAATKPQSAQAGAVLPDTPILNAVAVG